MQNVSIYSYRDDGSETKNPCMAEFGVDAVSSALPATAPASSFGSAVGYFGNMVYEEIIGDISK